MTHQITKCSSCLDEVVPDRNGDCPSCRRNIIEVKQDVREELQFVCVVCNKSFFSFRDETGFDQAPCPDCGDLSNTPDFHAGEMARGHEVNRMALYWFFKILAMLFASGLGFALLSNLF